MQVASWARALRQSLLPDSVLQSLTIFQIISQICFTYVRAFRPAGLPIARARMSLVRTAQSWIRTFPQIFAYILNAHSALACSRASMSWLINPRARTLRARPSVQALTGSFYMSFPLRNWADFLAQSDCEFPRVHPSRACMFPFPINLVRSEHPNPSKSRVQTCCPNGTCRQLLMVAHALYAPACLTRALRVYAYAPLLG